MHSRPESFSVQSYQLTSIPDDGNSIEPLSSSSVIFDHPNFFLGFNISIAKDSHAMIRFLAIERDL